jgi:hypothetical protein
MQEVRSVRYTFFNKTRDAAVETEFGHCRSPISTRRDPFPALPGADVNERRRRFQRAGALETFLAQAKDPDGVSSWQVLPARPGRQADRLDRKGITLKSTESWCSGVLRCARPHPPAGWIVSIRGVTIPLWSCLCRCRRGRFGPRAPVSATVRSRGAPAGDGRGRIPAILVARRDRKQG